MHSFTNPLFVTRKYVHCLQEARRNSQKKVTNVAQKYQRLDTTSLEKSMLPPATSEEPISPEARTAQWILSNVPHSSKDSKRPNVADMHTVLTPKDVSMKTCLRLFFLF